MEKLLTCSELAEILGISEGTLKTWVCIKKIPYIKMGGRSSPVRFKPSQIEEWLRSKEVKPHKTWR